MGLHRCWCGGEMTPAEHREVRKRGACRAPASHGYPWRASAPGPGERSLAHTTEADRCPLMLRDVWVQEEPQEGQASLCSHGWVGNTGGGHPCQLQEPGREERCFPFPRCRGGPLPTCFGERGGTTANCWGGLALGERMLKFKGEKISTCGRRNEKLSP